MRGAPRTGSGRNLEQASALSGVRGEEPGGLVADWHDELVCARRGATATTPARFDEW
jgi:hypothetical protein